MNPINHRNTELNSQKLSTTTPSNWQKLLLALQLFEGYLNRKLLRFGNWFYAITNHFFEEELTEPSINTAEAILISKGGIRTIVWVIQKSAQKVFRKNNLKISRKIKAPQLKVKTKRFKMSPPLLFNLNWLFVRLDDY